MWGALCSTEQKMSLWVKTDKMAFTVKSCLYLTKTVSVLIVCLQRKRKLRKLKTQKHVY